MSSPTISAASAEVRAHATRRARRAVRRWQMWGFPLTLLAIGSLAGLAVAVVLIAGGGI